MDAVALDPLGALLLGAVAFAAGFIDAIAGGGGLLLLPALLGTGMPPHFALGTNKLAGTFGTFSASLAFIRKGLFQPGLWWAATLATFIGAMSGSVLIYLIHADFLKKTLPLVILAATLYLIWPRKMVNPSPPPVGFVPGLRSKLVAGTAIGFYDGFIGPGTGSFWTAVALRIFRQDIVRAAGVARFMNLVSNVASMLAFMALGVVDYGLGVLMGLLLMTGAFIGAHGAIRFGGPFIRPVLVIVVLLMTGRLLLGEA